MKHDGYMSSSPMCSRCGSRLPMEPVSTKKTPRGKTFGNFRCRCGRYNRRMMSRPLVAPQKKSRAAARRERQRRAADPR